MEQYEDVLYEKRYISPNRAGMCRADRAAQFSAFAALTGFDAVIRESGRLTQTAAELDECEKLAINEVLQEILDEPDVCLQLVWFCPDERKSGGAYVRYQGRLKKIELYERVLLFTDGTQIPIDSLCKLQIQH